MPNVYLDWASTSPPLPESLETFVRTSLAYPANPSSEHEEGKSARSALEGSRARIASLIGARKEHVFFTSGGTESASIVLLSLLLREKPGSIVITAIEHPAVYEQARVLEKLGWKLIIVKPGPNGIVEPESIMNALDAQTVLVSCMAVNNETGAIQNVAGLSRLLSGRTGRRARLFCDAVQAFGKIHVSIPEMGPDFLSLSSHKIQGPRGVGILYAAGNISSLSVGGGQEHGIRPGTENSAGAAALAHAAQQAADHLDARAEHVSALMERFLSGARAIGARPIPECRLDRDKRYSPYIASVAFPGLTSQTMVRAMSDSGYMISSGSACSGKKKERRILDAMALDPSLSFSTVRVSLGHATTEHEIDGALGAFESAYTRLKS